MLSAIFNGLKIRRRPSTYSRPVAKSRRPELESMETRCLLTSYMSIDTPTVIEGTGGTTPMTFTVNLFQPAASQVTVNYKTTDNTAKAGSDYIATSGQLTFAKGEQYKTITVQVIGNTEVETSETFYLDLSKPTNAVILKSRGVGSIVDDDAVVDPELSIQNVSMTRGLNGFKYMTFEVSLNTAVDSEVRVQASTQNVTAMAGPDYEAKQGTLVFAAGETTKTFTVKIFGTSTLTSSKAFRVNLTNATVALKIGIGVGTLNYGA